MTLGISMDRVDQSQTLQFTWPGSYTKKAGSLEECSQLASYGSSRMSKIFRLFTKSHLFKSLGFKTRRIVWLLLSRARSRHPLFLPVFR